MSPRRPSVPGKSGESRPSRCVVAGQAVTRRPQPRGLAPIEGDGEERVMELQRLDTGTLATAPIRLTGASWEARPITGKRTSHRPV